MATILGDCTIARKTVSAFANAKKTGSKETFDPELLRISFFHLYYCYRISCGEQWQTLYLDKNTDPEVQKWLERWNDMPDKMNFNIRVIC
ncbi:MAG: hypothetical protein A3B96_02810 [Candidatus Spechtbacteria bacterium RIFCSPHIGHO2_02_FULL_43_15b]|uniref:Uncharacterized protein n=1 Tax=Candidatus Spechtbacteria bacterium RIFCSPHIGHO2_01_FULL_43_30 TaxID=1802158 RepID=A0A1G2H733_9BACT|nr:MAG: hypothetical protein A2827_02965 [Candidatus Spechtbacteria bacterium RIFCSPHIGHO2_01_FULL_43_30]OGZ60226.1 MAG: hypothetical protein A3B96_02810 [Candidatus Spechtbacteria bacterium RIFCSPHIGHO2_02_FULL_43_15b]